MHRSSIEKNYEGESDEGEDVCEEQEEENKTFMSSAEENHKRTSIKVYIRNQDDEHEHYTHPPYHDRTKTASTVFEDDSRVFDENTNIN
jgi:hypothetical protein